MLLSIVIALSCFLGAGANLLPDFFLDDHDPDAITKQVNKPAESALQNEAPASDLNATFSQIKSTLNEDLVKSTGGIIAFDLKGKVVLTCLLFSFFLPSRWWHI